MGPTVFCVNVIAVLTFPKLNISVNFFKLTDERVPSQTQQNSISIINVKHCYLTADENKIIK
jgi:hypothetical protein